MTPIGRFFEKRSISKNRVARKADISDERMIELTKTDIYYPYANEVKLIALAIHVSPAELFEYLTKDVRLPAPAPQSPFPEASPLS